MAAQLHYEPAKQLAQLRMHVNDVSGTQITPFLNNWGYGRTRETALGNVRLMQSLNQQLHVPGERLPRGGRVPPGGEAGLPLGRRLYPRAMCPTARAAGPRRSWRNRPAAPACVRHGPGRLTSRRP